VNLQKAEVTIFGLGVGLVYIGALVVGLTFGNLLGRVISASVERINGPKLKT